MASTADAGQTVADEFSLARLLVASLLRYWPHPPGHASPSLLLCGPSGSGKTHLLREAVTVSYAAMREESSGERQERVVVAAPALAPALTVRTSGGDTGLRRVLREAVRRELEQARASLHNDCHSERIGRPVDGTNFSVLLVLDHLEFFLATDGDHDGACDRDGAEDGGSMTHSGLWARHPALLTDLITVLTSAPALFTPQEAESLSLRRVVYVSVVSGLADSVHPFLRDSAFNHVISLITPDQSAREEFFLRALAAPGDDDEARTRRAAAIAAALALRTGGVSYDGLTELAGLCRHPAPESRSSQADGAHEEGDRGHPRAISAAPRSPADDLWWRVGACAAELPTAALRKQAASTAQRLVACFQSSGSVAALAYRQSAGFVDVQHTRWDDIAGMAQTKELLQDAITRPLRMREHYRRAAVHPSSGILLHGPPGTGKTMLAKGVATELNASFVYIDLPSLVQCEVGESERMLKAFFAVAKERSPSVIFMDELQAAFGVRYHSAPSADAAVTSTHSLATTQPSSTPGPGSSHDARLVSHLLQLLDEAQEDDQRVTLFIGATNVVHLLDPLLLRAGRLDTHVEVALPDTAAREHLARSVVIGDWASWWPVGGRDSCVPCGADADARVQVREHAKLAEEAVLRTVPIATLPHPPVAEHAAVTRVQNALVHEFVRRSPSFSGAELRNATSVFALKLMLLVSKQTDSETGGWQGEQQDRSTAWGRSLLELLQPQAPPPSFAGASTPPASHWQAAVSQILDEAFTAGTKGV